MPTAAMRWGSLTTPGWLIAWLSSRKPETRPRHGPNGTVRLQPPCSKGLLDNAFRELEQALAADPTCADAVVEMAEILIAQGKVDDAEERINELLARECGHPRAKLTLALVKLKRGQLDDAEILLKEALAVNTDPVRAHYYLGQLYEQRGDYKSAMEHYRGALERALGER